jgi:hypothetical protein
MLSSVMNAIFFLVAGNGFRKKNQSPAFKVALSMIADDGNNLWYISGVQGPTASTSD